MSDQARLFDAGPDPFGRMWRVQFRWLQTGISIRHADTVDVKFFVAPTDGTNPDMSLAEEKVIALPHAMLLKLATDNGRKLTDPWCMQLAAAHLRYMIETSEDMEKTLVTVTADDLARASQQIHLVTAHR